MQRILRLLLFVLCPAGLHAATYYVATNGDDTRSAATAQNISTPWKTIQKAANTMGAGDTCYIRGGTYRETVTPLNSGSSGAPITFAAYGSEVVTIDGTENITGWTTTGGNIWNASMTWTLADGNQVFIDGVMKPEARWPNAGPNYPWQDSSLNHPTNNELGDWTYANSTSYTNNASGAITDPQLPTRATNYWNGAVMHIVSGYGWIMLSPAVTSYNDSTKTLVTTDNHGDNPAYAFTAGNEYYLTGLKGELDSPGEWFYDPSTSTLSVYATASPGGVMAKKRSYGFNLSSRTYITLQKLHFFACTVQTNGSTANITYDGLNMKYLGHSSVTSSIFSLVLRNGDVLRNSELAFDSRALVSISGSNIRVINNYLHDSGYNAGWEAMIPNGSGNNNLISHNTLQHAGRAAMGFPGRAAIVEYNDMSDAMKLTTDGGVFYTNMDAGNGVVRYNLMHDSPGPKGHGGASVQGFYLDCFNDNWVVHHNIIWNLPGYALQFNCRHNFDKVFNNTCWGAAKGSLISSFPMTGPTGTHVFNNLLNGSPSGSTWSQADVRYNMTTDPQFVSPSTGNFQLQSTSQAISQGIVIPGVTDGFSGTAPDLGALEYGGTDWTTNVGYKTTPPSPDPTYTTPPLTFANQVKDGSFESGALAPNWTTIAGSNITMTSGNAWNNTWVRTDAHSLQFGVGTSEVIQTVTGLLPGRRYRVSGSVQTSDPTTTVKLGVRNYGFPTQEVAANPVTLPPPPPATPTSDGRWWTTYEQSFITGASNTSAQIYLHVVIPSGVTTPVYADDFGVELADDPIGDPVYAMPSYEFPLDETSGTVVHDSTTNGRNGTVVGGATWTAGHFGNALNFNGSNSYATVPGAVPATSMGSFSVAMWVKFNDLGTATNYATLLSNNNGAWAMKGWQIKTAKVSPATAYSVGFYLWSADQGSSPPPGTSVTAWFGQTVSPNQWVHVAFVVNRTAGTLTGYLNGSQSGSSTIPAGFTNVDTALGTMVGSSSFSGQLDDVRVYDYALSGSQVAAMTNPDTSKVLHLELNETAGATKAWNSVGNGNNGVLTNMNTTTAWQNGALSFDGVNDYVAAAKTVPTTSTGSFTVSTWVKFNDLGAVTNYSTLLSNNNGGWAVKGWQIKTAKASTATNFSIGFYLWSADQGTSPPPGTSATAWFAQTVPPGQWVHVAFVVDRPNSKITPYLNGAAGSPATIPAGFTDVDTALGTMIGSSYFSGQLDDVRAYSRALSWNEILDLAFPDDGPPY